MRLPYENPTWERLRKESSNIGYHFEDTPSMDSYSKRFRESEMRKEDYAHDFACIETQTAIPQEGPKGKPNVKYHYEGLERDGPYRNYGITQSE